MDNQELHGNGGITAYFCDVNVVDWLDVDSWSQRSFFTVTAPVIVFSHVIWLVLSNHSGLVLSSHFVPLFFNSVNGPTSILTELYLFKMKRKPAQSGHLKITRALLTAWTQTPNWEYSVVRGKNVGLVTETEVNCRIGAGAAIVNLWSLLVYPQAYDGSSQIDWGLRIMSRVFNIPFQLMFKGEGDWRPTA